MSLLAESGHHEGSANARAEEPRRADASGNYATVNGLRMDYETRGEGEPLALLHGGVWFGDGPTGAGKESSRDRRRTAGPRSYGGH